MTNADVLTAMMEEFKQALADHTKLTAQRDEMMQKKMDSLMLQIKDEVYKISEQEHLNKELKAEVELQKMLLNEKDKQIHEQDVLLRQMELEQCDLISEIESQKMHMDEKDRMINEQSDMIQEQAELISEQVNCIKNQEIKANHLRMESVGIKKKNDKAIEKIDDLEAELKAQFKRMRMTSIKSIVTQQKYLDMKEQYLLSQKNWDAAIDVYFKQIEEMNEFIMTLHSGNENKTMLKLLERVIENKDEMLPPIPEEDEDAYVGSEVQETTEIEQESVEDDGESVEGSEELAETENVEELAENENILDTIEEEDEIVDYQEAELIESEQETIEDVEEVLEIEDTIDHEEIVVDQIEMAENDQELTEKSTIAKNIDSASNSNVELNCDTKVVESKDEGIESNADSNLSNADSNGE